MAASIDVQEVSAGTTSPHPSERTWSFKSPIKLSEKRTSTSSSNRSPVFSKSSSWTFEYISLLVGLGSIAGIVAVLATFNGQALPDWPHHITLNALIALLATVANANIAIPLQSGLSQLKWIRFKSSRAPLADMEVFDEASRGTWGALKLLVTARGGIFGSFGAVITIVALAIGPFAQQIALYKSRVVEIPGIATVPRALNYTGALPSNISPTGYAPILPMKSAVYNGLFAENGRPAATLPVSCQTGNCTWESYDSLAACTSCVDITEYITRYCDGLPEAGRGNMTACGWQVPQGAKLNTSADVFSMASHIPSAFGDMPHSMIMKLIFMGTETFGGQPGGVTPWALQCTLDTCVQTIHSTVVNGAVVENVTSSILNNTVVDISNPETDGSIYLTGSDNTTYLVDKGAILGMRGWFSTLFRNGSATRSTADFNQTITDSTVVVNLTVGISSGETFFDSDIVTAFYWNFYQYEAGLPMLMNDLATSMSVAFRSFLGAEPVSGVALATESYVHVRWGFVAVPVAVILLTAMFLGLAIWRSRRSGAELWKSSALAMLFHGLDSEAREQFGNMGLEEKVRLARDVRVQLDDSVGDGKAGLLRI
ncbi:hypothetical protein K402DRAFT_322720 [Aulographum hederae CBS 113979]|uniref:Uncharacterized protein n=1 Tax=Aulographum hederae CBS 113979 TaxID=1176131 RepID=A0A6G1HDR6_9PEZI|nr:hypothetical protein K402DRAFT_322720 [Aulographum hederae CBS 113979]